MDWTEEALVLSARPHGENGLIVHVLTAAHGRHAGFVNGGQSRNGRPLWQAGNLVRATWQGRVSDQLGNLSGEMADAAAARAMEDAMALDLLAAACAVADGALPEREPHKPVFHALAALSAAIELGAALLPGLVAFEAGVLAQLGYGLDLDSCAATGATENLVFVSPRTGRAVSAEAAGPWKERLFPLPGFMRGHAPATRADLVDGLRITGHFLKERPFAALHRDLPAARTRLYDRVAAWAAESPEASCQTT
jgi:DNA repair protein RecO (recombination protein O)